MPMALQRTPAPITPRANHTARRAHGWRISARRCGSPRPNSGVQVMPLARLGITASREGDRVPSAVPSMEAASGGSLDRLDEQAYRERCATRLVEIAVDVDAYAGVTRLSIP